jgi:acyl-CoA thioester hydrolase
MKVTFKVRDYECDQQGIVNNAVYMNYFEHARHEYLDQVGLSFKALVDQGIFLMVTEAKLQYKRPLRAGETFVVHSRPVLASKFRLVFEQEIVNAQGEKTTLATTTIAGINQNKKLIPLDSILEPLI